MSHYSRRQILSAGGFAIGSISLSPVELLLKAMTKGFIENASAEVAGQTGARNYINLALLGGPLRYQFDQWIRTKSTEPQFSYFNTLTGTRYQGSGSEANGIEMGYFDYKGTLVPHLFSQTVQTSAGNQSISDLLNNMLVIRGYGTGLDGHTTNLVRQMSPLGGVQTLSGLVADNSKKTFDSVQWPGRGGYGAYNSLAGKSLTTLTGARPAHSLLEGFAPMPAVSQSLNDRNKAAFELAKSRLSTYVKSDAKGAKILGQNQSNALALMKKGVANLDSFWSAAVPRYKGLIDAAIRTKNIVGISDRALLPKETVTWMLESMRLNPNFDLRSSIDQAVISNLAESFALCEYMLKENLGSSVEIQSGNLDTLTILLKNTSNAQLFNLTNDHHTTGSYPAIFLMNQYYRGLSAALLELIGQLKSTKVGSTDLWSETLIQIVSEFGRSLHDDGSGSDHGWNQMITSVFGGCITNGPYVVGNVSTYAAQGGPAEIAGYNQKGMPTPVMMASTVAALMRVPHNPYSNLAEPLVSLEGSKLNLKFPGKLINEG